MSSQDPELQDPLSLGENYDDERNLPHHDPKKAQASPDYDCETPEIHVIIKEEEDSWTVSDNREWKIFNISFHHLIRQHTHTHSYSVMICHILFCFALLCLIQMRATAQGQKKRKRQHKGKTAPVQTMKRDFRELIRWRKARRSPAALLSTTRAPLPETGGRDTYSLTLMPNLSSPVFTGRCRNMRRWMRAATQERNLSPSRSGRRPSVTKGTWAPAREHMLRTAVVSQTRA